ncbi:MAG: helix-turn-helix domain-containing protein [Candidatus Gottesmanbacteria bacterium]
MLTVDEVAEKLEVSRNTVVSFIKKGQLGALKIGGQYKIGEENLRTYISNATIPTMKPDNS